MAQSEKYKQKYEKAIEMHNNGFTFKEIYKTLKMDRQILRRNMEYDKIFIYNQNNDKYRNKSCFQTINTEEKAYWLGFLYADGYVSEKENKVELTSKDFSHIKKFKDFVNVQNTIRTKKAMGNDYYRISFRDKKITEDLVKKGCFQNKSLSLRFPTLKVVPLHLQRHFIKGYFDGDGCVGIYKYNRNGYERTNIVTIIIGTKPFLNKLIKVANLDHNIYSAKGRAFEWRSGKKSTVKGFLDYIYKDSLVYLDRKYEKYLQIAVLDGNI